MGAQAGFNMRDRDAGNEGCRCGAARARRIALHDEHVGRPAQQRPQRRRYVPHVPVGIGKTRAVEPELGQARKAELVRVNRLLPGEDERGREPAPNQRVRDRRQFDGFGPGADDQPDFGRKQPSP